MSAYPVVSNPYGFKPVNRIDGLPYAGAIRQIPIASNYNTAIYNGDPVYIAVGGTIAKSSTSGSEVTSATIAGVFVGCQYVNSSGQTVQAQYYPGTSVTNAIAYVVDDPMAAFKVAVAYANGTVTTVQENAVGTNMSYYVGTGSTTTGDSGAWVTAASGNSTSTLPWRVIAVVPDTNVTSTTFCEVIVKINTQQYNNPTGLTLS
jgi:hypothetical protein